VWNAYIVRINFDNAIDNSVLSNPMKPGSASQKHLQTRKAAWPGSVRPFTGGRFNIQFAIIYIATN
jgi:hypothetical protein